MLCCGAILGRVSRDGTSDILPAQALSWRSTLAVSLNNIEGWNAYWAAAAAQGQALYPAPSGLVTDNYPPLSFHLIGLLVRSGCGHLVGRLPAARASALRIYAIGILGASMLFWALIETPPSTPLCEAPPP